MTSPSSPPNRRRRQIVVTLSVLLLVSLVSWWSWPRVDARFIGKWHHFNPHAVPPTDFTLDFRAVVLAEKACQLTRFKVGIYVGTLAAAYAEAGRFDDAIRTQEKAESLLSEEDLREWGFLRKLYESRQPYRRSVKDN